MNYLMKVLLISCLTLLSGCSSLTGMAASSAIGSVVGGGAPSLDAELVVGSKETEYKGQVGDNIQAEMINNIQDVPMSFLLLAILGWMLPSPKDIWDGFWKSIGNGLMFIRKLFKGE